MTGPIPLSIVAQNVVQEVSELRSVSASER